MKQKILILTVMVCLFLQIRADENTIVSDLTSTCSSNCLTCTTPNSCTSCRSGYYLKYESCFACGSKCASCTTNTKCKLCEDGYHLNGGLCYPNQKTTGLIAFLAIAGIVIIILLCRVCRDCKNKNKTNGNYERAIGTVPTLADPHHVNVHQPVLPHYMNPMFAAQGHNQPGAYGMPPTQPPAMNPNPFAPVPQYNPAAPLGVHPNQYRS